MGRIWGGEMFGSKQLGFSLTELMLAIFVLAIIMVAASSGIFQMSQGLVVADRSQRNFCAQESGSFMRDVFSKASPTFFFAHVPISLRSATFLSRTSFDSGKSCDGVIPGSDAKSTEFGFSSRDQYGGFQFRADTHRVRPSGTMVSVLSRGCSAA
jgi:prepilin-type N-terminal cleavage/methylation domain-containing protein